MLWRNVKNWKTLKNVSEIVSFLIPIFPILKTCWETFLLFHDDCIIVQDPKSDIVFERIHIHYCRCFYYLYFTAIHQTSDFNLSYNTRSVLHWHYPAALKTITKDLAYRWAILSLHYNHIVNVTRNDEENWSQGSL